MTKQDDAFSTLRPLRLCVACQAETGQFLTSNGDALATYDLTDQKHMEHLGKLYLVADGRGGHPAGKIARRLAIETIPEVYYHQSKSHSPLGRLQHAFLAAHTRICAFADLHPSYPQMTTTCTVAVLKGTQLWIGHIGESRAYLVHPSSQRQLQITRLTTDHTVIAARVRAGEALPEEMRSSPLRNQFLRALGKNGATNLFPYPDFVMPHVRSGDALLLCSDGLWSAVAEEQIAHLVSPLPTHRTCEELVHLAEKQGGENNISTVLLSFFEEEVAWSRSAEAIVANYS